MAVTMSQLLAEPAFHLRLRTGRAGEHRALDEPLTWAHSSDLADPTPWLTPGGLLLTDGTQFDAAPPDTVDGSSWAESYVARLVDRGVTALGFATRVVHATVPDRLVHACRTQRLPLVEVADRTPFMSIIAFVNDATAKEHREKLEWSLAAHRAIARAALRPDGLTAVLRELEARLGCWVALFDAGGYRVPTRTRFPVPVATFDEVTTAVRTALARGTRGSVRLSTAASDVTVQTLGASRKLQGALVVGTQAPLRGAERELVTSVIALASIALDQSRATDDVRRQLRTAVLQLLLAGEPATTAATAAGLWGPLPVPPLRVVAVREGPSDALQSTLERSADRQRGRVFFADLDDQIVVLAAEDEVVGVRRLLARLRLPAGCSPPVDWPGLRTGLDQARRAAARAGPSRGFVDFAELADEGLLGLLEAAGGTVIARRLLGPIDDHPHRDRLLSSAATWLRHHGAWDPAARELGVHRHTLRNRVAALELALDLDLDRVGDRAELWAALQLCGSDREQ